MDTIWPVIWPEDFRQEDYTDGDLSRSSALAISSLRALTLNRVGQVRLTQRPFRPQQFDTYWYYQGSTMLDRHLRGRAGGNPGPVDRARRYVRLVAPVTKIEALTVDGKEVAPDSYEIQDGAYLVKKGDAWPKGCDLEVTYLSGYPVPVEGQYAAGLLAEEFAHGINDPDKCRLPRGVTDIARQGVTISIQSGLFPDGMTGLPEVDAFIYQWNPNGLKQKPTVHSPDISYGGAGGGRW